MGAQGRIVSWSRAACGARCRRGTWLRCLTKSRGRRLATRCGSRAELSRATRILVVTEGVLARMILDDPELPAIAAVVFDEFHERSLDGDLGLALALDVQRALRPDLRLSSMSATLDGASGGAAPRRRAGDRKRRAEAIPSISGTARGRPARRVDEAVAAAVLDALAQEEGSVLAFLPGQREIERTAQRLVGRTDPTSRAAALSGCSTASAQDAAIRPAAAGRRKVVLATAIAETSITIDGVRMVMDGGLSRCRNIEPATGLTRLETVRVSRASADQRAGRAGRTAPGVALRLWRAEQTAALPPSRRRRSSKPTSSGMVLDCAAFGRGRPVEPALS